jgi:hypothetical protein
MKVADGFEPGAVIAPLTDMMAIEKVEAHIADAVNNVTPVGTCHPSGNRTTLGTPAGVGQLQSLQC